MFLCGLLVEAAEVQSQRCGVVSPCEILANVHFLQLPSIEKWFVSSFSPLEFKVERLLQNVVTCTFVIET